MRNRFQWLAFTVKLVRQIEVRRGMTGIDLQRPSPAFHCLVRMTAMLGEKPTVDQKTHVVWGDFQRGIRQSESLIEALLCDQESKQRLPRCRVCRIDPNPRLQGGFRCLQLSLFQLL